MKKIRPGYGFLFILMLLVALALAGCGSSAIDGSGKSEQATERSTVASEAPPISPEDAAATEPSVEQPEQRIVSTTVAITQIMDLLGIELVGVPKSVKVLPTRYDEVTRVGNPMSPDMELVKSLKPTEVLSVTTLQYELEPAFGNAGIEASFLDLTSLESMQKEIAKLGERFGKQAEAAAVIAQYDQTLERIREATTGKEKPSVLILLGVPGSYLVATEHSYIGDLVRLLGGENIAEGAAVEYLASNTEHLQQANPDVILRAAHGMPEQVVQMFDEEFKKNDIWKHFKAVQNNRVYDLEEALFGTTGNLSADTALEALLPMLYP